MGSRPGLYYQTVDVMLTSPVFGDENALQVQSVGLVDTAGLIQSMIGADSKAGLSSSSATLEGSGIRHGYWVTVPNSGDQWASLYTQPILEIQVDGPSEADVTAQRQQAIARIHQALTQLEDSEKVPKTARIDTSLNPIYPITFYDPGQPRRAQAASFVLGLGLTLALTSTLDRRRAVRRKAKASRPVAVGPAPVPAFAGSVPST